MGTLPIIYNDTLDVCLADHCSLKCKNCSHFSPYFKTPSFYPLEAFKKDVKTLVTGYQAKKIRFLGGEPLLHPEAEKFFEAARASGGFKRIDMITNGLALNKFGYEKYQGLDRVQVSVYTSVKFDYIKTLEAFEQKIMPHRPVYWDIRHATIIHPRDLTPSERERYEGFKNELQKRIKGTVFRLDGNPLVELPAKYFRISIKFEDRFRNLTPDEILSDEDAKLSYDNCALKKTCNQVHNGYFYKCPRPQNMKVFPKAAHVDYEKIDGIPLHEPNFSKRLHEYMNSDKFLESCKWCKEGLSPIVYEAHEQLTSREFV